MTKLEPTRTSSDLTATERLRRMLDERGVEYETDDVSDSWYEKTTWSSENNLWWTYEVDAIEELPYGTLTLLDTGSNNSMRPAQAIAATLGNGEYERKMDALLCRLTNGKFSKTRAYDLDFMESVVREEFETDDTTLGAGECEADETETIACRCYGDPHGKAVYHIHVMECTECGHTYEHVNGDYEYCPRCGRRIRIRKVDGE